MKNLGLDEYCSDAWNKAESYIQGVEDGSITCNKWVKLSVKQYRENLNNPKFEFKKNKVDRIFKFFSLLKIPVKNKYTQFKLIPYQAYAIINVFGFYYKDTGRRKYHEFFLWVGRKNSKSTLAAAINLFLLVGDNEIEPQVLLVAKTTKQASNVLNYAKSIVRNSPAIQRLLKNMQYKIKYQKGSNVGYMEVIASDSSDKIEGTNVFASTLDEVFSYPDQKTYDAIRTGTAARQNYLLTLLTTADSKVDTFAYDYIESAKNVLSNNVQNENLFSLLYTLDEEDTDISNEKNWEKSNPALGEIFDIDYLREQYHKTTLMPSLLTGFIAKHLNCFTNETTQWIDELTLQACDTGYDEEILKGHTCYVGIDLSSTKDLTALVLLFYIDEKYYVKPYFFMANNPEKKIRKAGIDLSPWIKDKHIIECSTRTIDYELLYDTIKDLSTKYSIEAVGYDSFNSALLIPRIEELGINCYDFLQNAKHFNFPLKYLEKQIYDNNIVFDKNPCMRWNFRNVVLYSDGNNNIKIMKNKSKDSVDGAVALGMAMGQFINTNLDGEAAAINAYMNN